MKKFLLVLIVATITGCNGIRTVTDLDKYEQVFNDCIKSTPGIPEAITMASGYGDVISECRNTALQIARVWVGSGYEDRYMRNGKIIMSEKDMIK